MTASAIAASPKRENKFKAFFRSRSRSRPRPNDPSQLLPMSSAPEPPPYLLPSLPHPHHLNKDLPSPDSPPSSYAKSPLRSQTRPVSSTTTATHSTITPLPSDVMRNRMHRGRHAYAYQPHSTDTHTSFQDHDHSTVSYECDSDELHFPRSDTPSSTRKLPLHSFFGISLIRRPSLTVSAPQQSSSRQGSTSTSASESRTKSSRNRSFRFTSRPSTPKSVDESSTSKSPYSIPVPSSPLPLSASPRRRSFGLTASQRGTPKSSTGHLPLPNAHATQTSRPHRRRHSVGSEPPPHDSAVALPEVPSQTTVHKQSHVLITDGGGRNKGKEKEKLFADSGKLHPDSTLSVTFTSQSLPVDPSPISRYDLPSHSAGHPVFPQLSTVDSVSSEENEHHSHSAPHHLPMIPRIIHTPPTPQRPGEVGSPSRPTDSLPGVETGGRVEITKGKPAHREQLLVSSAHSHSDVHRPVLSKSRFTPRFFSGKEPFKTKDGNGQKSSKRHTPGHSDGPNHKTLISATSGQVRSMTSHRSKLGSFDFERPVSALNRSCSTVDQQGTRIPKDDTSYKKPSLHSSQRSISDDSVRGGKPRFISGQAESSVLSQLKPEHPGDASVLSFSSVSLQTKSTGKGTGSATQAGHSSSWGRASGRHVLRTSHGTLAFEPSSMPGSPNPQTLNLPSGPNQNDLTRHTSGLNDNTHDTRVKHSRGHSFNPSDSGYLKSGERTSKGKGRSLDLGLGLSWAPSRLREEVLMPGLMLSREKAKQENSKTSGSDVTKVFENLLSESRFQTFKKYVRRFDAHIIPLEGPTGLLARVEKLLTESGLGEGDRSRLMAEFTVFVENHGG